MRERIIAANWKMNCSLEEGAALAGGISDAVAEYEDVKVVICPPSTHLTHLSQVLSGGSVDLGAQNVHWAEKGAFTGELSAAMLEEVGCKWVIIGHSERRQFFGETDASVNKRLLKAVDSQLRPIVCIGESLEDREAGRTFEVLERQLKTALKDVSVAGVGRVVIAYEPIWAIGTGLTATPDQAQEAHAFIRNLLSGLYDRDVADGSVIQYGGSVNEKNAVELMSCPDVDGGLIGGASLNAEKFAAIVKAASMK